MTDNKKGIFRSFNDFIEDYRYPPTKTSIKIALIGDGSTGKTSFFNRIVESENPDYKFSKIYDATQGCNISQIEYMIGKYPITLHVFDTAGQEKFGILRDSYLSGADAIILMYDLTDKITRHNVFTKWIPEVKRLLTASRCTQYIPIAVVGNKNDKIDMNDETIHNNDSKNNDSKNNDPKGIRTATLQGAYDIHRFGPIEHFYISVKADENLLDPINWSLKHVLSYYMPVTVKRSTKKPAVFLCNKK
jgi:GTP-binding nuclear protein Ran